MKQNEFTKAIKEKYFGGSSNPKIILLITMIGIVLLFFSGFFTFISEKEFYPPLFEWIKSAFDEESTTNTTTNPTTEENIIEDITFPPTTIETTTPTTTIETTTPTTTIETTQKPTKPYTEKDDENSKDITKKFTSEDKIIYYYEPQISGEYWFEFDISTVKSRFEIAVYNQKDEIIEESNSSEKGMLVYLNEGELYKVIISTDTDNYPFTAYVEIYEPNITQVIEVN